MKRIPRPQTGDKKMPLFNDRQDLEDKFVGDYPRDCPVKFKVADIDEMISKACGYETTYRCSDIDIKKGYRDITEFEKAREQLYKNTRNENVEQTKEWLGIVHNLRLVSDFGGLYDGFDSDYLDELAVELTNAYFDFHNHPYND